MNRAKIERIGHDAKTRPVISQGRVSVVQDFVKAIPLRAGAPLRAGGRSAGPGGGVVIETTRHRGNS